MTTWITAILIVLAACTPAFAADCALRAPSSIGLARHDPAAPLGAPPQALAVRVSGGTSGCTGTLQAQWGGVSGELLLPGPGGDLRATLSLDARGSQPLQAAPLDAAAVRVDAGRADDLLLWVRVLPGQWLAPGTYRAPLRLRLAGIGTGATLDEREVEVSVQVDAAVRVAFSGTGSRSARLDFGELARGARRAAALDVQSNTGHRVTLQSTTGGRLVNTRFPDSAVPYVLRVDGIAVPPNAGTPGLDVPWAGRMRRQVEAEVGAVERVLAGEYADDLLITITAQ